VKDYYEDLWERLPAELSPPDFALRRGFLLGAVRPDDRALDLGCGAGEFTRELASAAGSVIGVEVAEAALERARRAAPDADFRLAPIDGALPLQDASIDLVWASEVIEHVSDTATWLSEIRRVLAPAGRLLLTTPAHGRLRLALHGIEPFSEPLGDHLHLYTTRSLRSVLAEFDFDDVAVRGAAGPPGLRRLLFARAERP
jgi:ubiquinone/menaquinone biosynthesis C-methylase UbiE